MLTIMRESCSESARWNYRVVGVGVPAAPGSGAGGGTWLGTFAGGPPLPAGAGGATSPGRRADALTFSNVKPAITDRIRNTPNTMLVAQVSTSPVFEPNAVCPP